MASILSYSSLDESHRTSESNSTSFAAVVSTSSSPKREPVAGSASFPAITSSAGYPALPGLGRGGGVEGGPPPYFYYYVGPQPSPPLPPGFSRVGVIPQGGVFWGGPQSGGAVGNQPHGGSMQIVEHPQALPGYPNCGRIVIEYNIPDGVQTEAHPNPGRSFKGTIRTAYLPNNREGREVANVSTAAS